MPTSQLPPARLLTARQVAAYLAVSSRTVYTLIERGELRGLRVGHSIRIHPDALAEYMDRWRDEPSAWPLPN